MGWIKKLFGFKKKPFPSDEVKKPFPSDEVMKAFMQEHMMRCNDYYFEPAMQHWLDEQLNELGITRKQYSAWVENLREGAK